MIGQFDRPIEYRYTHARMMEFTGISASPGIARGKAFLFLEDRISVPRYDISSSQVESEYGRFLTALEKASAEVKELVAGPGRRPLRGAAPHVRRPGARSRRSAAPSPTTRRNVEWVLLQIVEEMSGKLAQSDSQYLRERTIDFTDAGNRILDHLLYTTRTRLSDIREPSILVTHNLMPSDTLGLDRKLVLGHRRGRRRQDLPHRHPRPRGGDPRGARALRHQPQRAHGRRGDRGRQPRHRHRRSGRGHPRAVRREGAGTGSGTTACSRSRGTCPRRRWTGSGCPSRRTSRCPRRRHGVLAHGADGIGLFRSEFLFIQPNRFPTEDEQLAAYTIGARRPWADGTVTIRTLDLGGDKVMPGFHLAADSQPAPGLARHPLLPRPARGPEDAAARAPARLRARLPADHVPPHLGAGGAGPDLARSWPR